MGSIAPETTAQQDGLEVAIVGAGIAGVALAIGLLSRGIRTQIYERGQSLHEIGAGIGFTPNAEWAMRVIDPRIHAAFKSVTVKNGTDWFMWMDGASQDEDGKDRLIHKMYLGERGFEGCHRAQFLEALVKLMPEGVIHFDKNLTAIADTSDAEPVQLQFSDGSRATADVVIGCDGIRSKVRRWLVGDSDPSAHPSYSHKFAFRGLVPMVEAEAVLGVEKTETRHMYLGKDGHALTFPVAGGKLLNVVAFTTDPHDWPHSDRFTSPATKSEAVQAFQHFNSTVRSIIALLPDKLDKWAVFDTYDHPVQNFARGRVCVSGDAAHAAAPHHGAGAGFAMEDGAVLTHLLDHVRSNLIAQRAESDTESSAHSPRPSRKEIITVALETYNASRLERAHWLVDTSRFVGNMYQFQDEHVGSDPARCAAEIEWRSRRIWSYDVDAMVETALNDLNRRLKAAITVA